MKICEEKNDGCVQIRDKEGLFMESPAFQKEVASFVEDNELVTTLKVRLLDLVTEIGELSKEYIKGSNYGQESFRPTIDWTNELGDTFFSLIYVANSTNINLEVALKEALYKYKQRLAIKGDLGSGK